MYGKQGFKVVAFPCHQFKQEAKEAEFIEAKMREDYGIQFPIFEKIQVNGPAAHPIFVNLKKQAKVKNIDWNFGKFLIDSNGKVHKYGNKGVKPFEFEDEIKKILK